jgi:predicted permease
VSDRASRPRAPRADASHVPAGARRLLRLLLSSRGIRAAIDDEIRFHLDSRVDDLVARGVAPAAARAQAEREYRDLPDSAHELFVVDRRRIAHHRREDVLMTLVQDLRYAVRGLARNPALTIVTTLALTIGIAANAVMFGVVDQLLLRPPAGVADPGTLHRVYFREHQGDENVAHPVHTYRAFAALGEQAPALAGVAEFYRTSFSLGQGADAASVDVQMVSGNYFSLLGVRPQLGRAFTADEDSPPNGAAVAVLSDGFWRRRFGGRTDAIGQTMMLDAKIYTVVGIAPANFGDLDRQKIDVWIPLSAAAGDIISPTWYNEPNSFWLQGIARVRPGVTIHAAEEEATTAYRHESASWAIPRQDSTASIVLGELAAARAPDGPSAEAKVSLWLIGVSAIVLLIACANVANLLIARTMQRRREIAVRLALGVSRGRLMRQLLTESALLAVVAAIAAVVVAHWGERLVERVLLPDLVWSDGLVDQRVLAFTTGAALVCIFVVGLAPALQGIRTDVSDALKASSRQVAGGRGTLRSALLVVQAALSVVLLVGSGLFVKSLRQVSGRDVGLTLDRVMLVSMNLSSGGYTVPQRKELFARGAERARAVPGVQSVAVVAASVPLRSGNGISVHPTGMTTLPKLDGGGPYYSVVTSDFFTTAGAALRAGRTFTPAEERSPSRVMLINEPLATAWWPGKNPVGECATLGSDSTCTRIVGVVENIVMFGLVRDDRAMVYLPPTHPGFGDRAPAGMLVRTTGDPAAVAPLVRATLQRLTPNIPYVSVRPLTDIVAPQLRPWRLGATMFTLFGAMALLIAAVGLYSVMAYWVSQRSHEIGVRMALGARRGDVIRLVTLQALRPIATGLTLGAIAAALSADKLGTLLYETSPHDVTIYAGTALVLAIAALLASIVPAHRSTTIDPATSLRAD